VLLVCGPPVMYKFVLMELEKRRVPHENIFLNLERKMKCGVGKCGHCQVNNVYVCMDGPVFQYSDLATMPEAFGR
jgi:NAD(P)H-flavin reductase